MRGKEVGQSRNLRGSGGVVGVSRRKASSLETQLQGKSCFEKEKFKKFIVDCCVKLEANQCLEFCLLLQG